MSSKSSPEPEPVTPVTFSGDERGELVRDLGESIEVTVSTVAEAKLAIKQLKLKKKAVALQKREVQHAINAINAERRDQLARQGRMTRGRGGIAQLVRAFEGISRDQQKAAHEQRLDPYQAEKARLDNHALSIDQLITQLEEYILQYSE